MAGRGGPPRFAHDLNGRFNCRLREFRTQTRSYRGAGREELQVTSKVAIFEADFDFKVLEALERQSFLVSKRRGSGGDIYMVYEVAYVKPTHYESAPRETGLPRTLRVDFLRRIDESWGAPEGWLENWIEIGAVYTGYVVVDEDGNYRYEWRPGAVPLIGSETYILSEEAVTRLVSAPRGTALFTLKDADVKVSLDMEALVKYHAGVFGFTGGGKSNLTAFMVRKLLEELKDLKVIIVDVAGEYAIYLADLISEIGIIYTTENFNASENPAEAFLASQAIPETLIPLLGGVEPLKAFARNLLEDGLVNIVNLSPKPTEYSLKEVLSYILGESRAKAAQIIMEIGGILEKHGVSMEVLIREMNDDLRRELIEYLEGVKGELEGKRYPPEKLIEAVTYALECLRLGEGGERRGVDTPEDIAEAILREDDGRRLVIIYTPDPVDARITVSRLIEAMFKIRKRSIGGPRVLVVLDEAQEFIPDRARKEDLTDISNRSVERLLRQGRKYRLHCWIATQRLAHLNTNALQQIHTYFVNVLPRTYDRGVVANAVGVSPEIVDRTADLEAGEWLLVSHKALARRGVAVFVKAPNNEEILAEKLLK